MNFIKFDQSYKKFLGLLISAMLVGCTTTKEDLPHPIEPVTPVVTQQATPGIAIIYFLRPQEDQVEEQARPSLKIDDHMVGILDHGTYTAVLLKPGTHRIAMTPGPLDSSDWNQQAEFKVDDGATYYIALWHQNQPEGTANGNDGFYFGQYGLVGNLVFHIVDSMSQPDPVHVSSIVRFENIDRSTAEFSLPGVRYVQPQDQELIVKGL